MVSVVAGVARRRKTRHTKCSCHYSIYKLCMFMVMCLSMYACDHRESDLTSDSHIKLHEEGSLRGHSREMCEDMHDKCRSDEMEKEPCRSRRGSLHQQTPTNVCLGYLHQQRPEALRHGTLGSGVADAFGVCISRRRKHCGTASPSYLFCV